MYRIEETMARYVELRKLRRVEMFSILVEVITILFGDVS